jgi:hypothetical protein
METNESAAQAARDRVPTFADRLRELAPPGSTVYTVLRHVNRSGSMRVVSCYVVRNNEPVWLASPWVAEVAGFAADREREGNRITGGGMDMGFVLVYDLSAALYGDGYALKQRWL